MTFQGYFLPLYWWNVIAKNTVIILKKRHIFTLILCLQTSLTGKQNQMTNKMLEALAKPAEGKNRAKMLMWEFLWDTTWLIIKVIKGTVWG